METVTGTDGLVRCWWGAEPEIYRAYHDTEWGWPSTDDTQLFEKICLEGFQSGLSWLTILRKRDNFRAAFNGFDPQLVAHYGSKDVDRLLGDEGIVRNEAKIRSTINNASRALEMIDESGSLARYFWEWSETEAPPPAELRPHSEQSAALAKDLKRRGWTFVGPTTIYAFMQAMGLVNDHLDTCHVRDACAEKRRHVISSLL